jgi:hypothetical protein
LVVGCLIAIAAVLVVAVRPSHPARPATKPVGSSLSGTFTLWHSKPSTHPCTLVKAYRDVRAGAPVTVRDTGGRTVGTGRLAGGAADPTGRGCVFAFSVPALHRATSYTVAIGTRAALSYTRDQLNAARWAVHLNLGLVEKKAR